MGSLRLPFQVKRNAGCLLGGSNLINLWSLVNKPTGRNAVCRATRLPEWKHVMRVSGPEGPVVSPPQSHPLNHPLIQLTHQPVFVLQQLLPNSGENYKVTAGTQIGRGGLPALRRGRTSCASCQSPRWTPCVYVPTTGSRSVSDEHRANCRSLGRSGERFKEREEKRKKRREERCLFFEFRW